MLSDRRQTSERVQRGERHGGGPAGTNDVGSPSTTYDEESSENPTLVQDREPGYARLARQRWQRWAVPLAAFGLAVVCHALHNMAVRNAIGLNPLTVAVTWAGVLVIVVVIVWSLRRQRRWLATELVGEVPDEVYRTMTVRGGRGRARWEALRQGGLSGWRQEGRVHQQCAELAIKKRQRSRRPDEPRLLEEIARLRTEIRAPLNRQT